MMSNSKEGNGSKVDELPKNTCSRKYIWNLKVIVAKQRAKPYDPLSRQEDFYFTLERA